MNCLITGHTRGIGKALYDSFKDRGYQVDGVSRGTGFDIVKNYNQLIEQAVSYDVVINNAYTGNYQYKLLEDLNNKVENIITIGSIAGYYTDILSDKHYYSLHKKELIDLNRRLSYRSSSNLLLINVGLTENASPEPGCSYKNIVDACWFWLSNPSINQIDFKINLTPINVGLIEADFKIKLDNYSRKFF